jgi:hypothetical protein
MRAAWIAAALGALAAAGCLFLPDIGRYGYTDCKSTSQCGPGRICQAGYCVPPAWWDEKYTARHQVLVANDGSTTVTGGVVLEFVVGEGGALTVAETGSFPALVFDDRVSGEQQPAAALREPRGDRYAFVFKLPADVAPKTTFGNLWLYTLASDDVAPTYSAPTDVYSFADTFDGSAVVANTYRIDGVIDVNDGQAIVRSHSWLVTVAAFKASEVVVDLQLLGANCADFGFGFSAGRNTQSLDPPYAMFIGDPSGTIQHEVWSSTQAAVQPFGAPFPADGQDHRLAVAVAGPSVVFSVDGIVTAEGQPTFALDGELHVHLYSNGCDMRVAALQVSPRPTEMPAVTVDDAVTWYR